MKLLLESLRPERVCNICGSKETLHWHRDIYWGKPRLGVLCNMCFSSIKGKEDRGIVGVFHKGRKKGSKNLFPSADPRRRKKERKKE